MQTDGGSDNTRLLPVWEAKQWDELSVLTSVSLASETQHRKWLQISLIKPVAVSGC